MVLCPDGLFRFCVDTIILSLFIESTLCTLIIQYCFSIFYLVVSIARIIKLNSIASRLPKRGINLLYEGACKSIEFTSISLIEFIIG